MHLVARTDSSKWIHLVDPLPAQPWINVHKEVLIFVQNSNMQSFLCNETSNKTFFDPLTSLETKNAAGKDTGTKWTHDIIIFKLTIDFLNHYVLIKLALFQATAVQ